MDTMLNPMGRIGPVAFRNAALILIAVGAVFSLLPLAGLPLAAFGGLLLLYPWAVIWVKRFHDAGKSGKLFLAVLAAWLIVSWIAGYFISAKFAPAMVPSAGPPDVWALMAERARATAIPSTIVSVVISLAFALVLNEELKSDPQPNVHGTPPVQ